jgi:hypothetical protein
MRTATISFLIVLPLVLLGLQVGYSRAQADAAAEVLADAGVDLQPVAPATAKVAPTGPTGATAPDPIADTGGFLGWVKERRQDGSLFSWLTLIAFTVLAAVWKRLQPPVLPADATSTPSPSKWRKRGVAIVACALGIVALAADIVVGAGHLALVATSVGPVVIALVMSPFVDRGAKARAPA